MFFEWDQEKEFQNIVKHGVSFDEAKQAFQDDCRCIELDEKHSQHERRYHCYGMVEGRVMTVRFTYRGKNVRILGAAYWRKGKKIYAKKEVI